MEKAEKTYQVEQPKLTAWQKIRKATRKTKSWIWRNKKWIFLTLLAGGGGAYYGVVKNGEHHISGDSPAEPLVEIEPIE